MNGSPSKMFRCRSVAALLALFSVLVAATFAQAAPLAVGATLFPVPAEPDPTGGAVACGGPLVSPYVSGTFSGTLTTIVYVGDPSNPYGPGALTFTWKLHNDASSVNVNARLTVSDWTGFLSDASFQPGPDVNPTYVDRLTADVIGFSFLGAPIGAGPIGPGQDSDWLVVQTDATTCVPGVASVIDGTVAMADTLAPAPEPSTIALLGLGALALVRRRRAL